MAKDRYLRDSRGKFAGSLPNSAPPAAAPKLPDPLPGVTGSPSFTVQYWNWDGNTGQVDSLNLHGKDVSDPDVQFIYRNGQCHSLAYHLHLQTGGQLGKLVLVDHEEGIRDTVHFFVFDPQDSDYVYDVGGRRHFEDMCEDMAGTYESEMETVSRAEFRKEVSNKDVWLPLELVVSAEYAHQIVAEA